jgi:hypothetical protein
MSSWERRIVHLALRDSKEVRRNLSEKSPQKVLVCPVARQDRGGSAGEGKDLPGADSSYGTTWDNNRSEGRMPSALVFSRIAFISLFSRAPCKF